MIGELTKGQIEQVLSAGVIGRISCCDNKQPYTVPLTYVYRKPYIYAHSKDGMKIRTMRKNPSVCFLVDEIDTMVSWRSVIAFGKFEELKTPASIKQAVALLKDRLEPLTTSESTRRPSPESDPPHIVEKDLQAIYFRLKLDETSGRFEKLNLTEIP